jgi:hypothetical protein
MAHLPGLRLQADLKKRNMSGPFSQAVWPVDYGR